VSGFVLPVPPPVDSKPSGDVARSDKARITSSAPAGDLQQAVSGQNDLAFDLYRELTRDGENLFLSPVSIYTALSMTYAGAAGTTAQAFEQVLGSGLAAADHHRAMNDLEAQLTSRGQNAAGTEQEPFRLNMTNQVFAQQGFPLEVPYLDTLALDYGAGVRLMDFAAAPDPSRVAINAWVAQQTEDRIKDLLAPGIVSSDTRLVLVNAIYFNAAWSLVFDDTLTSNRDFGAPSGTKSVPMMHQPVLPTRAAQVNGTEIFEMAYDGDEMAMVVIVPPEGGLASLEATLDAATFDGFIAALTSDSLNLKFPRFEARTQASLSKPLKSLGLEPAFSSDADFSAMTPRAVAISEVVHECFVKVDEKGTEAAAATAVIVGETSVPMTRELIVDRPFVFAVRDNATGALAFVGRVVDP
jgi:serpin B